MPTPSESSSSLHAADRQGDHVELAIEADTAIVSVIGDYDISNRDELSAALERAAQSRYVLVDLHRAAPCSIPRASRPYSRLGHEPATPQATCVSSSRTMAP